MGRCRPSQPSRSSAPSPRAGRQGAGQGRRRSWPAGARRLAVSALGLALVWGALGALGYVGGWQLHARRAAGTLVGAEQRAVRHAGTERHVRARAAGCVVSAPESGQLAGLLEIPAIHLTAPVEEGTTDGVLSVAVGHDPSSVWPGADGTAALLAHDVSYFVHLDALGPGDVVRYRTACSTTRFVVSRTEVVAQGTPIPETASSSLVLDTCYPSDALFFTSRRLLVWATEVRRASTEGAGAGDRAVEVPPLDDPSYRVPAPAALVAQGLTLQQNEAPMGTMTLGGATSPQWAQSPGPLALEAAALEAYFGGLHASAQARPSWWRAIAGPDVAMPAPLLGAAATQAGAPLDVEIVSSAGTPVEVVLTTEVVLRGGRAPGTYAERVTTAVRGAEVTLSGWSLRPVA
jgi:sortase A